MADQSPGSSSDSQPPEIGTGGAHAMDPAPADAVPADSVAPESVPAVLPPAAPARHATPIILGKVRSPVGCWLLVVITLGIYGLFWYHHTNRELRDFDSSIVVKPGLAVLALFIPIVGWFSIYNPGKRIL